jgi:hypothetical protein
MLLSIVPFHSQDLWDVYPLTLTTVFGFTQWFLIIYARKQVVVLYSYSLYSLYSYSYNT